MQTVSFSYEMGDRVLENNQRLPVGVVLLGASGAPGPCLIRILMEEQTGS
jgi:hypothetical protein